MPAPITLFVYNRPEHTLRTLISLNKNELAEKSELFIYADGPKATANEKDLEKINKVRQVIRQRKWCKAVEIVESSLNCGTATSIVKGVSEILKNNERVIVLEDDLILSPGFLNYMNSALDLYSKEEKVMHISGYMFPVKKKLPETFFLNLASCWGWGTWARSWKYLNTNANDLLHKLHASGRLNEFNLEDTSPYLGHLTGNVEGFLNTWAIKWYASIFLNHGFCLHPHKSLVSNIGMDGSGVHCGYDSTFQNQSTVNQINVSAQPLIENKDARIAMTAFYKKLHRKKNIIERAFNKLISSAD